MSSGTETLDGSVHVIVGASGGIGSSIARRLAASGANVALVSREKSRLSELADETGGLALEIAAGGEDGWRSCFDAAAEWGGRLDGAVNCAGSLLLKPAHLTTLDEFGSVIEANLTSAFQMVKAAGQTMRKGGGSVVLMSSAASQVGLANHEAIAAAKAGVIGLARSAAATYAGAGVRFNAIAPGLVETPLTERITGSDAALASSIAMHPLGRIGRPEDLSGLICWLLSSASGWVTGQVIGVDGGLSSLKTRARA